ncbi:MAG: FAD-dependent oxidoreductase [Denitromonas halophila]|nr:MAG: FAD-dependent oxidoreductase [Denitromonas halophila]
MREYDVAIVGAGPAGMSAASQAAALGLSVVLMDEQPRAGGQIYRNVGAASRGRLDWLGPDYAHGRVLVEQLASAPGVTHLTSATVWDVSSALEVSYLQGGSAAQCRAKHLIVATGAMERPSPLPGWTLPGVMNAGAAQIMMKVGGAVPEGRIVLVGGGPLLYLVAVQLLDAGAQVAALLETSSKHNRRPAMRHLMGALRAPGYLIKGMRLLARIRRAGVAHHFVDAEVAIEGGDTAEAVVFNAGGKAHRIAADTVLLHHGVIPNVQLTRMLRLEHDWDARQLAWRPRCDAYGVSSHEAISVTGDGAGIGGARAAECSGAIAALGAACRLGVIDASALQAKAAPLLAEHQAQLRIRPFLDTLYQPPDWLLTPTDDTIVCRCEEVTAGQIRDMARLGCTGPNQTKFFSRSGMGPCQGRMCGVTVAQLIAQTRGVSVEDAGYYRIRPPLKPIPLAALASMDETPPAG